MPHQFGLEYARDRSTVIIKQIKRYEKVEDILRSIEKEITSKRDHPYLSRESLSAFVGIQKELATSRRRIEKLVGSDPYAEKLLTLFDGKVGEAPTGEQLKQLELTAKERYEKKVPPGFSDLKDKGAQSYGDDLPPRN